MIEWRAIKGYEGQYEVSNTGSVRSLDRWMIDVRSKRRRRGQLKALRRSSDGYLTVGLHKDGKFNALAVHRLVLTAFRGDPLEGQVGCHNDGIRSNNHLENLRWDSQKANQRDALEHGTRPSGDKHPRARVLPIDRERVHDLRASGLSFSKIAKWLGSLSDASVRDVVRGRRRFVQANHGSALS
jgi:hypothetical protein